MSASQPPSGDHLTINETTLRNAWARLDQVGDPKTPHALWKHLRNEAQPPSGDAPDLRELLHEAIEAYHQTGSIRDHADDSDTTGWHVKGIETCSDRLCVDALAGLAASAPSSPATPAGDALREAYERGFRDGFAPPNRRSQPPSGDARCTHRDLAGNEAHVAGCPQLNAHGYTCGFCAWGRDHVATRGEYEAHKAATGHVGEPPSGDTPLGYHGEKMLRDFEDGKLQADDHDEIAARLWMIRKEAASQPPSGDALREYGRHLDDCLWRTYDKDRRGPGPCTCGFTAALATSAPSSPATPAPLEEHEHHFEKQSGHVHCVDCEMAFSVAPAPLEVERLARALESIDFGATGSLEPGWCLEIAGYIARAYANQEGGEPRKEDA